ncbi:hypothetical protein SARC_08286 [Sphaeroforma arctica JP610]|uniref:CUE domain-containing protein n=1 Tax=Sphaeroforma arctica JP610 TaxID=667725 RepID=A0A0L0FRW8_9EUKA|nr:hypothetical protein SARC_08286 [Sphaeroforma arctica JP610]KNC79321.1 hypothetical protein SARC_08286 [Sphaeroforma arctica JP610]|eukprot:XP_014153223.1 hypothetical protein SARC_08286 [Sphaeroforma arctica JP610]
MVRAEVQHSASDQSIGHFSDVAFGHDIPTYPVAVSVQSPAWLDMNVHVPSASKLVNRLWVLYSPCTLVTFSALPAVSHGAPASSDTDTHMVQAHADDCQYRIAHTLGVGVHARHPIHEQIERVTGTATHTRVSPGVHTVSPEVRVGMSVPDNVSAPVQPGVSGASVPVATIQAGTNRSHSSSQEVEGSDDMKRPLQNTHQEALADMLARVQKVFPSHDREVIMGDLRETMNVDATIENVITGALQFPPNAPTSTEPTGKHEMSYDRHTGSQLGTSSAATAAVDDSRGGYNGSESSTSVHTQNTVTQPHTQDVGAHTAQRTDVQPGACAVHLLASHTDRQFSDKMLAAYIDCGSDIPTAWSYDDSLSKKKLDLIVGARKSEASAN